MDKNPACSLMTADCSADNECQLTIDGCRVTPATKTGPACSTYDYRCIACGDQWTVHFPQVQPVFDRDGTVIQSPAPIIEPA